jgi:hypothetical protein
MCRAYGISTATFMPPWTKGRRLEEALRPEKRKYYRYKNKIFMHREGLMAYAGVLHWEDIEDQVVPVSIESVNNRWKFDKS